MANQQSVVPMLYGIRPYWDVSSYIYSTIYNLGNQSEDLEEAEDLVKWNPRFQKLETSVSVKRRWNSGFQKTETSVSKKGNSCLSVTAPMLEVAERS